MTWNATFKDRMDFYGVEVRLCRYYRAQTKGKVESGVKYVKRNALIGQSFASLSEVNEYLLKWCLEVADQRIHGTTHEKPAERFEREGSWPSTFARPRRESSSSAAACRRTPWWPWRPTATRSPSSGSGKTSR